MCSQDVLHLLPLQGVARLPLEQVWEKWVLSLLPWNEGFLLLRVQFFLVKGRRNTLIHCIKVCVSGGIVSPLMGRREEKGWLPQAMEASFPESGLCRMGPSLGVVTCPSCISTTVFVPLCWREAILPPIASSPSGNGCEGEKPVMQQCSAAIIWWHQPKHVLIGYAKTFPFRTSGIWPVNPDPSPASCSKVTSSRFSLQDNQVLLEPPQTQNHLGM